MEAKSEYTLDDPHVFYHEFNHAISECHREIYEIYNSTSELYRSTMTTALEAVTLFNPECFSLVHAIEDNGQKMEQLVLLSQEMKNKLSALGDESDIKPIEHFSAQLKDWNIDFS